MLIKIFSNEKIYRCFFFFFFYFIVFIVLTVQEFACSRSYGVNKTTKTSKATKTKQKTIPISSDASVTEAWYTKGTKGRNHNMATHATTSSENKQHFPKGKQKLNTGTPGRRECGD